MENCSFLYAPSSSVISAPLYRATAASASTAPVLLVNKCDSHQQIIPNWSSTGSAWLTTVSQELGEFPCDGAIPDEVAEAFAALESGSGLDALFNNTISTSTTSEDMVNLGPDESVKGYSSVAADANGFVWVVNDEDDGKIIDDITTRPAPSTKNKRVRNNSRSANGRLSHVEAERQRREKLNQMFYELRSLVPNVSRMDKASLLSDTLSYINELKRKVDKLEVEQAKTSSIDSVGSDVTLLENIGIDVKIMESHAMIRVHSEDVKHSSDRLMNALRELEFEVQHASISRVKDQMLHDVMVRLPENSHEHGGVKSTISTEEDVKAAVFAKLKKQRSCRNQILGDYVRGI